MVSKKYSEEANCPKLLQITIPKELPLSLMEFCKAVASSAASHWICLCHDSLQTLRMLTITFKDAFFGIAGSAAYLAFAFHHGTHNRLSVSRLMVVYLSSVSGRKSYQIFAFELIFTSRFLTKGSPNEMWSK